MWDVIPILFVIGIVAVILLVAWCLCRAAAIADTDWQRLSSSEPEMEKHDTESDECWCHPEIEILENGEKVIIHQRDQ